MDDISNIQDDNLGGLTQIRIAPAFFFSSLFTATFKPGYDWITIDFTKETMPFNERWVDDVNGGYADTTIGGSIPQIREDVNSKLQKYSGKAVVVECEDNNGKYRRAGTNGRMIMVYSAGTGTDVADMNGYQVQISGKQRKPSLFFAPIIKT